MCDSEEEFLDQAARVIRRLSVVFGVLGAGIGLAACLLTGFDQWIAGAIAGFLIGSPIGCFLGLGLFVVAVNQLEETSKLRKPSASTPGKPAGCDCSEFNGVTP